MNRPFFTSLQLRSSLVCILLASAMCRADEPVEFVRDVQPLLAARCIECHGPEKNEGGLRLDVKKLALEGGDSGEVIAIADPDSSELLNRVRSSDEDIRMPPEGERLSAEEIKLLEQWIRDGASWPDAASAVAVSDHWAFQPIHLPVIPDRPESHPIDRFVRARLSEHGIKPSEPADRYTLARRLSLDLTGLPPSDAQIDKFYRNPSTDAWEQLVDRFLESPHFGERWAMPWLDLARYADSDGYEKDTPRPHAWHWRDWVIDAINRDLPFDQFTVQQLAGDLLPGATNEVMLATGFHRNTLTNREGGVDQEEFRVAAVIDRNNTTFTTWMGLTVACAQCHTHKYDPITQREFYSLYAFFNETNERDLPAEPTGRELAEYESARAAHTRKQAELDAQLESAAPAINQRLNEWAIRQRTLIESGWTPLEIIERRDAAGGIVELTARTSLARLAGIRLQVAKNVFAEQDGVGEDLILSHLSVRAQPAGNGPAGEIQFRQAIAEGGKGRESIGSILADDDPAGWQLAATRDHEQTAWFTTATEAPQAGFIGNNPADGAQDGASNLLNVYHASPIPGRGTVDSIRVFTKAAADSSFHVFLLRPAVDGLRVVDRREFMADGSHGQKQFALTPAWQVEPGDLFAHWGNGGPTFSSGDSTADRIYYPLPRIPAAGESIALSKLPTIPARAYAMAAGFQPVDTAENFFRPEWDNNGANLTFRIRVSQGRLGELKLSVTDRPDIANGAAENLPTEIAQLLSLETARWSVTQRQLVFEYFLTVDPEGIKLKKAIDDHAGKMPKKPQATWHIVQQGGPRQTHVHLRGDFREQGRAVSPEAPSFLPPLTSRGDRPDRLDLARWIVSAENPLTSRVAVNHIWATLFGRGLVATPDDFGTQGEPPSHPELLDWLAIEFQRLGWSRKALIRQIVLSETYRQSSRGRADLTDRDPDNRLLARQNRFRLDAELVRDQYLAAAGLLDPRVGGPSFRPPLPDSVTRVQFVNNWKPDAPSELYRRGMYIHLQRNMMLPMLITFDRPEAILACTRRDRSNTPLQALTLLNAPRFVEAARALATALTADSGKNDEERIEAAFRRIVSRPPSNTEQARTKQLLEQLTTYYNEHPAEAGQLAGEDSSKNATTAAAWVAVCRTLLNLDEVITRE